MGTYYRPPDATADEVNTFLTSLQQTLDILWLEHTKSVFLLGDFNDRCLEFSGSHDDSELKYRLVNLLNLNNLYQVIEDPTRVTPTSASLLDLIITDSPGYIMDSGVLPPMWTMDHCPIYCKVKFTKHRGKPVTRKVYKSADYISLRQCLSYAPWDVGIYTFDDMNYCVDFWYKLFVDNIEAFVPSRVITTRPKDKEWMDQNVRRLINRRDRLYRGFSVSLPPNHYDAFLAARRETRSAINLAKETFYGRLVNRLENPELTAKEYY